ncbi:hypothetical protein EHI8A_088350 [Entamoeba histolytica HM-1:IMSS-B]|uniref:UDENN domain-containing protein n=6 Tax=Entamoeba histolytica TaxID=5759 RepID=C4LYT5_ENTH1|nr:hypothetical protein EHI_010380 [Entamoeba histolytica HM-1:IMSS]EMD44279.1 Hypothetical protein EHI5A_064100 [Entamoeba histolytica KU27]EMH73281.1 hypothetical protein EHI8A_088350 [Entamoeba histolytica HM-1:IMSS-B]EMS15433.1 hypothetical protein KM1_156120 [Entamoeba histolytica HM-3:IMSS]ENY64900.1 hypothetical protein EHI7A_088740 [Entamoeba histolytica HM-1:IMSS-A]GAT94000.1 hypothetical protein CL6EHI_010380 [Entamoeba histolytica]|eukprot:XP_654833.1 hypothetical protein EHI_010380 [Entamoeba histolytica HM-1:IMSS]
MSEGYITSPLIKALTQETPNLINSFAIFGVSPSTSPNTPTPQIQELYKYPESYKFPLKAEQFIVPRNPTIIPLTNNDVFKEQPIRYITILPGEIESVLCVCIQQNEFLNITSDLINPTGLTTQLFSVKYYTQRTYCFTTTYPYFLALFPLLHYIAEHSYRNKLEYFYSVVLRLTLLSPNVCLNPIKPSLEAFIHLIFRIPQKQSNPLSFTIENNKYTFARSSPPLPSTPLSQSMSLVGDYSLIRLFCTMSVEEILNILSVMLCGMGVILISENISTATSCIFGFLALFYPFTWPGIFIPYIPDELFEFYETPVPILCSGKYPPYQCRVNAYVQELDQSYFSFFMSKISRSFISLQPNGFTLPWRSELLKKLTDCINKYVPKRPTMYDREKFIEMMPAERVIEFSSEVMKIMNECLYRRLENSVVNFCTEMKECSLDNFIKQFPQKFNTVGALFMKKFVESQHFNVWWYQLGLNTLKIKSSSTK